MTNGSMILNGITDKQVARAFEFKTLHEDKFLIQFTSQPNPQNQVPGRQPVKQETTYDGFNIYWNNDANLKIVLELVNLLLQ